MSEDKLQAKLVDYLEDAHAMETNVLQMLGSMIATTTDPQIKRELEDHKRARPRARSGGSARASRRSGAARRCARRRSPSWARS